MDLRELLKKQESLDGIILERAGIKNYPYNDVKLALLTELGELANEVQSFKYWKQNKEVDREKVLEEFADCLHFALSLENQLNQTPYELLNNPKIFEEDYEMFRKYDNQFNRALILAYQWVSRDDAILISIISLGICLEITLEEMEQSYLKKYEKNLIRQQEGY